MLIDSVRSSGYCFFKSMKNILRKIGHSWAKVGCSVNTYIKNASLLLILTFFHFIV